MSNYIHQFGIIDINLDSPGQWVIMRTLEKQIIDKIVSIGVPLKDWNIKINYGIKTGCNEAFIISTKQRDFIINNCKSDIEKQQTSEIIRPILRGRDILRYGYKWNDLWLLFIPWHFPLQNDSTIVGSSSKAEAEFALLYPSVYQHLLKYKDLLLLRNSAETGIRYEWYALQRWGADYWEDFNKPKVIWKIIGCNINFSYDDKGMFCNNAVNIMTGSKDILIQFVGLMNSKLFDWYLKKTTEAEVQGGGIQLYVTTLEKTILKLDFNEGLSNLIIRRINSEISDSELDEAIYNAYNLSEEEKQYIERQYSAYTD